MTPCAGGCQWQEYTIRSGLLPVILRRCPECGRLQKRPYFYRNEDVYYDVNSSHTRAVYQRLLVRAKLKGDV